MIRIRGRITYPSTATVPDTAPRRPPVVSAEYLYPYSKWRVPEEDNRLLALWGLFSTQEIADMMGRSRRTVREKAEKLGLIKQATWIKPTLV